jgi:hypothetical protein
MTRRADVDEQAIVQGYLAGRSLRDLAADHGVSMGPIKRILKERGVATRPPLRGPDRAPRRSRATAKGPQTFTHEERAEVISRFLAGETQVALSERFACGVSTIARVIRAEGVPAGAHGQLREHHHNWKGGRIDDHPSGYIFVRPEISDEIGRTMRGGNGYVLEHRLVMAHALGRPLTPEETVHHGPGGKADNRIENLELWASRHPRGQRVEDLVAFAREILELYGDLPPAVVEPAMLA